MKSTAATASVRNSTINNIKPTQAKWTHFKWCHENVAVKTLKMYREKWIQLNRLLEFKEKNPPTAFFWTPFTGNESKLKKSEPYFTADFWSNRVLKEI